MPDRHTVFVALGANLDDPVSQIEMALAELDNLDHCRLIAHSSLYASAPAGFVDQPDYVNAVAMMETGLLPRQLLDCLLGIERHHGRQRSFRDAPRTLDLDILLYDQRTVNEPGLHIPHPRMHERAFVLLPLAEIAPEAEVPGHGTVKEVLAGVVRDSVRLLPRNHPN